MWTPHPPPIQTLVTVLPYPNGCGFPVNFCQTTNRTEIVHFLIPGHSKVSFDQPECEENGYFQNSKRNSIWPRRNEVMSWFTLAIFELGPTFSPSSRSLILRILTLRRYGKQ